MVRRGISWMDFIKIGGFIVSFGTFLILALNVFESIKDNQAQLLAEVRGIHAEIGGVHTEIAGVVRQVDLLNEKVFRMPRVGVRP